MSEEYFQHKYRIPSARYAAHDYNHGTYFVTVCTLGMEHYFGEIVNGKMILNRLGEYLLKNIQDVASHYPYAELPVFQVMPNHFHAIVIIDNHQPIINRRDGAHPVLEHVSQNTTENNIISSNITTDNADSKLFQDGARPVSTVNTKMMHISHQKGLLSTTIGGIKSAITKYANAHKITFGWQTRFHDRIIRDQDECTQIAIYIEQNPAKWEIDKHQ